MFLHREKVSDLSEAEARFIAALQRMEVDGAPVVPAGADSLQGGPGLALRVGERAYRVESEASLGESGSAVESARPDYLMRPMPQDSDVPPVAVFVDGFDSSQHTLHTDSCSRNALVRAGFVVWSLTHEDLAAAQHHAPVVPDYLAVDAEGVAGLQRKLDERWRTAPLRSRLAEASLSLLVRYLSQPQPALWKRAVFTQLLGLFEERSVLSRPGLLALRETWQGALPTVVRETLDQLPEPTAVAGAWAGDARPHVELLLAVPLAAVEEGDPDPTVAVVHLHDDSASRAAADYRRVWAGVLRLFNLLQFLPVGWWTTRAGIDEGLY